MATKPTNHLLFLAGGSALFALLVGTRQGRSALSSGAHSLQHGADATINTLTQAASSAGLTVSSAMEASMSWLGNVIARVSRHEGTYDSLNLNSDGAGLSFGLLQWSQRTGALGELLRELYGTDPQRFARLFGKSYLQLLRLTAKASLEPLEGAVLWREPWVSRFRAAGRDAVFQQAQDRLAASGPYMRAALEATRALGITSERTLAVTYDTAVQQGPARASSVARAALKVHAGKTVPISTVLKTYAELAAARYRRTTAPESVQFSRGLEWKPVGAEWHVHAGRVDLYEDIRRRRLALVADGSLSDAPVTLAVS